MCNYHPKNDKNILGDTIREKREKISRGAKVGTSFATTTSSTIKVHDKSRWGLGGKFQMNLSTTNTTRTVQR